MKLPEIPWTQSVLNTVNRNKNGAVGFGAVEGQHKLDSYIPCSRCFLNSGNQIHRITLPVEIQQ